MRTLVATVPASEGSSIFARDGPVARHVVPYIRVMRIRAATISLLLVVAGCFTGERPSFTTEPFPAGRRRAATRRSTRCSTSSMPSTTGPYTADYTVLTKFGNTTTPGQRVAGGIAPIGHRRRRAVPHRRRRIADVPARQADPCSSSIDPARISDTQITPDFYAADAAKRLRRSAVDRIGTPVAHVDQIAGQSATCVDVPRARRHVGVLRARPTVRWPGSTTAPSSINLTQYSPAIAESLFATHGQQQRSGVDDDQRVVDVVDGQRAGVGGDHDVLEAHPPSPRHVDAGLDAEGVARLQRQAVALDHVRVLVLLHADAVAGAVDEVLAVAGGGDDPPGDASTSSHGVPTMPASTAACCASCSTA